MSDHKVSMSAIARQLEIALSAVSNWRTGHPSPLRNASMCYHVAHGG